MQRSGVIRIKQINKSLLPASCTDQTWRRESVLSSGPLQTRHKGLLQLSMKCSRLWGEIQNQLNTEGALAEVSNQKHCKQLEMEEGRETEEGS